jgi:hypothetical protein
MYNLRFNKICDRLIIGDKILMDVINNDIKSTISGTVSHIINDNNSSFYLTNSKDITSGNIINGGHAMKIYNTSNIYTIENIVLERTVKLNKIYDKI